MELKVNVGEKFSSWKLKAQIKLSENFFPQQ